MIKLGDYNTLTVTHYTDFGLYLDGGMHGRILLPKRYVPAGTKLGQEIEVFIYLDQEERLIATTEHPLAKVGDCAWMECAWTNQYGAFLKWGLMKDLFCPFREQKERMEKGKSYYVYVMEDDQTHRLMATAKVEKYQKDINRQQTLDFAETLLRHLKEHNGYCPMGDKSDANEIKDLFGVSKKTYKKAVGDLYKRRLITLHPDGIRLV